MYDSQKLSTTKLNDASSSYHMYAQVTDQPPSPPSTSTLQ